MRPEGAIVIPMIVFIEGGMQLPMGRVTRDFFNLLQTLPNSELSQHALGSVDMLNCKMGVSLIYQDVNWVYNCQNSKETGYYFKTRVPSVRLISCLPKTNKGMDKNFLIVSGEWHDDLHCPT